MKRTYTDTCRRETKVNYTIDYTSSEPITPWGYVGYYFLWSIPVVGFILWLASCFSRRNKNVKNFARAGFCMFLVSFVLTIVIIAATFILVETGVVQLPDPGAVQNPVA